MQDLDLGAALQNDVVIKILITAALLLLTALVVRLSGRLAQRYFSDPGRIYRSTRFSRRAGGFIAVLAVVAIWSPGLGDLWTLLTVVGVGIAIALREVLLSMAGWMRIALLGTWREGDRVEIGGVKGDVIDVRLLRTSLMEIGGWVDADQSTGRIVHIPNSWIFEHAAFNYTHSFRFIWNELRVTVTYRSDWRAARDIMLRHAEESAAIVEQQARAEINALSREFLVHYSIMTPFVYVRMTPNGVELTLRYLCEARKRRGSEHALSVVLLDDFREHGGIEIAYHQMSINPPDSRQFDGLPDQHPRPSS